MDDSKEKLKLEVKLFLQNHSIVELMNVISEALKETNPFNIMNNLKKDEY